MKPRELSIGFGFRVYRGYREGAVLLPNVLIRLGPNFNRYGAWELSIDFGLKTTPTRAGETAWRHSWRFAPRLPVKRIWARELSASRAWTGRDRRCVGLEFGWGYARRAVFFR